MEKLLLHWLALFPPCSHVPLTAPVDPEQQSQENTELLFQLSQENSFSSSRQGFTLNCCSQFALGRSQPPTGFLLQHQERPQGIVPSFTCADREVSSWNITTINSKTWCLSITNATIPLCFL